LLTVTAVQGRSKPSKLSFGVEFEQYDMLLEKHASDPVPEEVTSTDYWEAGGRDVSRWYGVSPNKSMRIYHVSGDSRDLLVEGDKWEVEVVKCYLNPNEARTRDNRRKIHYTVMPIRRDVHVHRASVDFARKSVLTTYRCGTNTQEDRSECDVYVRRYRLENGWVVQALEASKDGVIIEVRVNQILEPNQYMTALQAESGHHMDTKSLRRMYAAVPSVPNDFLKHMNKAA
jgi:hypothetical protein